MSPANIALADWFHLPEIKEIDLSAWTGQPGQSIRIRALDDVQVTEVTVTIADETDAILEQGAAVAGDNSWWTYTTTQTAGRSVSQVLVSVKDLPGHITQMTQNRN